MSKVKNFPHLSRGLMDYWFKELLSNRYGSFEDSKIRVKQEISMSYLDYMSVMADRRTQLLNAQTSMAVTMARASANVTQLQYATKELDSLINDLAFIAQLTYSVCKLIKPSIAVGVAVRNALDNKVLVKESMKYWPGVNQYKAIWGNEEKDRVIRAVIDLAKQVAIEVGMEALQQYINELTHLFEPSFWVRKLTGVNPEDIYLQQLRAIENTRKTADAVVKEKIAELDTQITRARKEMDELLEYISGCETGK